MHAYMCGDKYNSLVIGWSAFSCHFLCLLSGSIVQPTLVVVLMSWDSGAALSTHVH